LLTPARKRAGWTFSISYTTREKRRGERNGREYHFVSDQQFNRLVHKNFFAEHFRVHLYRYGTPKGPVERVLRSGGVMLLDVDVKGAQRLYREYPSAITIFVLPPSLSALKQRLTKRGTETESQRRVRFENAKKELKFYQKFEYLVVNKKLNTAVSEVLAIIEAHGHRTNQIDLEQIPVLKS
jgi:guanylate kinase